jgi:hypothetical protein
MDCSDGGSPRNPVNPLTGLLPPATDGSILLSHRKRQFTISDAFFAFSAIQVHFGQVTGRANRACGTHTRTACVREPPVNSACAAHARCGGAPHSFIRLDEARV